VAAGKWGEGKEEMGEGFAVLGVGLLCNHQ